MEPLILFQALTEAFPGDGRIRPTGPRPASCADILPPDSICGLERHWSATRCGQARNLPQKMWRQRVRYGNNREEPPQGTDRMQEQALQKVVHHIRRLTGRRHDPASDDRELLRR